MADAALQRRPRRSAWAPRCQIGLPAATLIAMLAVIFWIRPSAMSYFGFTLLFKFAVPLMFAALGADAGDHAGRHRPVDRQLRRLRHLRDRAVYLQRCPACSRSPSCAGGASPSMPGSGLLIQLRQLPSIIVTLGMSFIWLGAAVTLMPGPGGGAALAGARS